MNIKQFLIYKACDVLPPELKYYISEIVQDDASYVIQRVYMYKVAKNVDIFLKLYEIGNLNNSYNWTFVNKFIKYAMNNITYTYIQEPGTWIDYLEQIIYSYFHRGNKSSPFFHANNVFHIINKIKHGNEIYRNTGIEWWDNF
mgnify:CR=1 FL=1|tara:strand:- start:917 stop:1345 length:429 start_codon:yes stop_codon:yes gene_type:complete